MSAQPPPPVMNKRGGRARIWTHCTGAHARDTQSRRMNEESWTRIISWMKDQRSRSRIRTKAGDSGFGSGYQKMSFKDLMWNNPGKGQSNRWPSREWRLPGPDRWSQRLISIPITPPLMPLHASCAPSFPPDEGGTVLRIHSHGISWTSCPLWKLCLLDFC